MLPENTFLLIFCLLASISESNDIGGLLSHTGIFVTIVYTKQSDNLEHSKGEGL